MNRWLKSSTRIKRRDCYAYTAVMILAASLLLASMVACDSVYGVVRRGSVSFPPDVACVKGLLESVTSIASVEYQETQGARRLSLRGSAPPGVIHTFSYRGDKIAAALQFFVESNGATLVIHSLSNLNERPQQEFVDATRSVMRTIEKRLETECNMANLTNVITEECKGVKC